MGAYNTYGEVQLKVGDVEFRSFKIGDKADVEDGVYVGREGTVVIVGGIFIAEFPYLISKWGDVIRGEDVIRPHDYIQDAVTQAELQNIIGQGVIPTRDKVVSLIKLSKRDDFVVLMGDDNIGRTPEQYFEEYSYREPEVWIDVLNDLLIPIPQVWIEFVESHG